MTAACAARWRGARAGKPQRARLNGWHLRPMDSRPNQDEDPTQIGQAAFVAGRGGVTETEVTAWEQDLAGLGDDYIFSLNRYLFIAQRS